MRIELKFCLGLLLMSLTARAQEIPSYRTNTMAEVQQLYEQQQTEFTGDTNKLVALGVLADKEQRRVVVQAETTGLNSHDIAEFFVIAPQSGNDYEALSRSFATAEAIDRALRFIGMTPGRPADEEAYRFWPKGERVHAWIRRPDNTNAPLPLETLVLDETTGKPLAPTGLVYVQASTNWVAKSDDPNRHPVDADTRGSIAANYNEPCTLFDVPRAAPQSEVYSRQTVNPDHRFEAGERVEIVLEPEGPAGELRVQDLDLAIHASSVATQSLVGLRFSLTNKTAGSDLKALDMNDLLEQFTALCQNNKDPFVTLHVDENVQMDSLKAFSLILASIETDHGIRVEPPIKDHLYYKAYMPDNSLRDRDRRIMQPAELTFSNAPNGNVSVSLLEITEHWKDEDIQPSLTFRTHPIDSPQSLREQLSDMDDDIPVLLVFVPPTLTHGTLMHWLSPILATHPLVHVFTPSS